MPAVTILYDLAADAEADVVGALLDGGRCDVYDGALPTDGTGDVTTQTLCFSVGFATAAFLPSKGGVIRANPMSPGKVVCDLLPNGTPRRASWYCTYTARGDAVFRGNVGTKDASMIVSSTFMLPDTTIVPGSFTHVVRKSPFNV